jgi:hypothetical protein
MSTCETCSGKGYIHTTGHPSLRFGKMYIERCDECFHAGRTTLTDEKAGDLSDKILYRVIGITGTTEYNLGEEENVFDASELMEANENYYDWVEIIEIPI